MLGVGADGVDASVVGGTNGATGPQSQLPKPLPSPVHACPPLQAPGPTHSRVCPGEQAALGLDATEPLSSTDSNTLAPSSLQAKCTRLV